MKLQASKDSGTSGQCENIRILHYQLQCCDTFPRWNVLRMILIARRSLKRIRYLLLVAFTILFLDFVLSRQSSYPLLDSTNNAEDLKAIRSVYIASSQWNSGTLLEKHWIPSLLQVVSELKSANISGIRFNLRERQLGLNQDVVATIAADTGGQGCQQSDYH